MGSGNSTKVHSIISARPGESEVDLKEMLNVAQGRERSAHTQRKEMENELAKLETVNFDLIDKIEALESQIDIFQQQHLQGTPRDDYKFEDKIRQKDEQIESIEKEIRRLTKEIEGLQIKYQRRLKTLEQKLVDTNADHAMKQLEMKEEMARLKEENEALREQARNPGVSRDKENSPRSLLILQLSDKITSQERLIIELQLKLEEKSSVVPTSSTQQTKSERKASSSDSDDSEEGQWGVPRDRFLRRLESSQNEDILEEIWKEQSVDQPRQFSGISRDSGILLDLESDPSTSRKRRVK